MKIDKILLSVEIDFPQPAGADGRLFLPTAEQFARALEGGILHWIASSNALAGLPPEAGGPVSIEIKISYDRGPIHGPVIVEAGRPHRYRSDNGQVPADGRPCAVCGLSDWHPIHRQKNSIV